MPRPKNPTAEASEEAQAAVIRRFASGEMLDEYSVEASSKLFEGFATRGKAFVDLYLLAVCSRRMGGLMTLFQRGEQVEKLLFKEEKLKSLSSSALLEVLKLLGKQQESYLDFIKLFGTGHIAPTDVLKKMMNPDEDNLEEAFEELSPERRAHLVKVLKVLSRADDAGELREPDNAGEREA